MSKLRNILRLIVLFLCSLSPVFPQQPGGHFLHPSTEIPANELKIGMSNAQTGRLAFIGTSLREGALAGFNKVNQAGGIAGRKLTLVSYDDGYEPLQAVTNTLRLINTDHVFALMGFAGTATCRAILPMLSESEITLIGPFSGAKVLRDPLNPLVYNTRASYGAETEVLVDHLVNDLNLTQIAVFRQDDSYGEAGLNGVVEALQKRNLRLRAQATYVRNSVDVQEGLNQLLPLRPQAVILVGAYKACANFIRSARAQKSTAVFCNLSFVGTEPLINFMGSSGEGVYISQTMPSPLEISVPLVKEYQDQMKAAGFQDLNYASLEGYVDARVVEEALRQTNQNLSRPTFNQALDSLDLDLGGFRVRYSADSHLGSDKVYLTRVSQGKALPVEKMQ